MYSCFLDIFIFGVDGRTGAWDWDYNKLKSKSLIFCNLFRLDPWAAPYIKIPWTSSVVFEARGRMSLSLVVIWTLPTPPAHNKLWSRPASSCDWLGSGCQRADCFLLPPTNNYSDLSSSKQHTDLGIRTKPPPVLLSEMSRSGGF